MKYSNKTQPRFLFTSDIDWASDSHINELCKIFLDVGIKPIFFVTHASPLLRRLEDQGFVDLGIHPNFFPNSDHGSSYQEIINNVLKFAPLARISRSHSFFENSQICCLIYSRGIKLDSNLCLYLQENLVPLDHWSGIRRYPVFWEDDIHWYKSGTWRFSDYISYFFTPGLKVINVHPFNISMNIASADFYNEYKGLIKNDDPDYLKTVSYNGLGCRNFLIELLETCRQKNVNILSLNDLV